MKSKKIKLKYLVNIDNYISKRDSTLLFLIAILAIIPSVLSGYQDSNLWERLLDTMQNPLANIMIFLGIIIIVLSIKKHICYNELFFFRFNNYKELLINGMMTVVIATLIFYTIFIFLAIGGSTFFSFGNYKLEIYEKYNIAVLLYLLFKFVKNILVYEIVSIIIFLSSNLITKKYIKYFLLLLISALFFFPYGNKIVAHFYQMPIAFPGHLLGTDFISLYTEIIISLIYISILVLVSTIIFKICIKRKVVLK